MSAQFLKCSFKTMPVYDMEMAYTDSVPVKASHQSREGAEAQ